MGQFAVYITHYYGELLPPFYVGSTSTKKLAEGYCGSVRSKKWKDIYKQELKDNRGLFKTSIVREFDTRSEALAYEERLQRDLSVVKSEQYFNEAYASGGCFGRDVRGELNPQYGAEKTPKMLESVKLSNTGLCTAYDSVDGAWCKVATEVFREDCGIRYTGFQQDERTKSLIAKNTAQAMSAKATLGEHWFQSAEHKSLVSKLRTGVPLSEEWRKNLADSRREMFKNPWEMASYSFVDFEGALAVIEWSVKNYVKSSRTHRSELPLQCATAGLNEQASKWLCRRLGRSSLRNSVIDMFNRYKERNGK